MKNLNPLWLSGGEVLPLVEGGKGISATNGESAGAWAAAGGVGTFSGVNAAARDSLGRLLPQLYRGGTRRERHLELIRYAVRGALYQARVAHESSCGRGRIHMNILWEMAAAEQILKRVLEKARGLIHGVTCGAGMPYRLAEICARFGVYYYPIVSSARAFRALWKRAYHRFREILGAVVYEDPWCAGGHNGLSNREDPLVAEPPRERVAALRRMMRDMGVGEKPIVMAGGVWFLREWRDWLDDPELGPVAFQFGTRPLLTRESPIPEAWKKRLATIRENDVVLHQFSPTGFYSSAVRNAFIRELEEREQRQVAYSRRQDGALTYPWPMGQRGRLVFLSEDDVSQVRQWVQQGFSEAMRTPDSTLIFVTPQRAAQIREDQINCMGCLSACRFSNWSQGETGATGRPVDPRSFCIQKTLQAICHDPKDVEDELMFAGHNAFRFAQDPFYRNGFVPTVKQLVERIQTGD